MPHFVIRPCKPGIFFVAIIFRCELAPWLTDFPSAMSSSTKDAAVVIQTFLRGAQAREAYAVMLVEHREAAKLENQIATLQKKLDEERQARLQMEEVWYFEAVRSREPASGDETNTRGMMRRGEGYRGELLHVPLESGKALQKKNGAYQPFVRPFENMYFF